VKIVPEQSVLRLHTDSHGTVWQAIGVERPSPFSGDLAELLTECSAYGDPHVRVLGTHGNARLITNLYHQLVELKKSRVEIASPRKCVADTEELSDPEKVLWRMRQLRLAAVLGGWHPLTKLDMPAYAIAAEIASAQGTATSSMRFLTRHPAYARWRFIPNVHHESMAMLIAMILDPRWFVDPKRPNRLARLRSYLGILPRYAAGDVKTPRDISRRDRFCTVLRAWKGREPSNASYERPENFLWRRWRAAGGGIKGDLLATRAFLVYFIRNWQQSLLINNPQKLELFDAESLLKGAEVQAFRDHVKGFPSPA